MQNKRNLFMIFVILTLVAFTGSLTGCNTSDNGYTYPDDQQRRGSG